MQLREKIDAAEGVRKADLVLTGGQLVNVATGEIYPADVAVAGDLIAAVGDVGPHTGPDTTVVDVSGRYLVPGLIDGHLHIECSKLSITMFADAVVRYGTTSVVSGLDQTFGGGVGRSAGRSLGSRSEPDESVLGSPLQGAVHDSGVERRLPARPGHP